jgi:hypothetical protein
MITIEMIFESLQQMQPYLKSGVVFNSPRINNAVFYAFLMFGKYSKSLSFDN